MPVGALVSRFLVTNPDGKTVGRAPCYPNRFLFFLQRPVGVIQLFNLPLLAYLNYRKENLLLLESLKNKERPSSKSSALCFDLLVAHD